MDDDYVIDYSVCPTSLPRTPTSCGGIPFNVECANCGMEFGRHVSMWRCPGARAHVSVFLPKKRSSPYGTKLVQVGVAIKRDITRCDTCSKSNEYGADSNVPGGWRCGQCRMMKNVFG